MTDNTCTTPAVTAVRTLRLERGWTIERTAFQAGLSVSTVNRADRGERDSSMATLKALAIAFDVPLSAVVDGSE